MGINESGAVIFRLHAASEHYFTNSSVLNLNLVHNVVHVLDQLIKNLRHETELLEHFGKFLD